MRNRIDAAKELRKLVLFSNVCVAPLVEDLKVRRRRSSAGSECCCGVQ